MVEKLCGDTTTPTERCDLGSAGTSPSQAVRRRCRTSDYEVDRGKFVRRNSRVIRRSCHGDRGHTATGSRHEASTPIVGNIATSSALAKVDRSVLRRLTVNEFTLTTTFGTARGTADRLCASGGHAERTEVLTVQSSHQVAHNVCKSFLLLTNLFIRTT